MSSPTSALESSAISPESLKASVSDEKPLHRVHKFTASTLTADCATALAVGLTAALPISVIDYSIMARVAGITDSSVRELVKGFKTLFLRPHKFFLPCAENKCALVYAVCVTSYGVTYVNSNIAKSYYQANGTEAQANLAAGIVSGITNTITSIWKDGIILKALPPANPTDVANATKPVPWMTRGLFCCRDVLTCVGAFTFAPMVANWIAPYVYRYRWSRKSSSSSSSSMTAGNGKEEIAKMDSHDGKIPIPLSNADTAQLLTPVVLQFVTTIFHIAAIRYRQTYPNFTMKDLNESLQKTYVSATTLRMCRIIPAFGLGGIMNRRLRSNLLDVAEPLDEAGNVINAEDVKSNA